MPFEIHKTYPTRGGWDAVCVWHDEQGKRWLFVHHAPDTLPSPQWHTEGGRCVRDAASLYDILPPAVESFVPLYAIGESAVPISDHVWRNSREMTRRFIENNPAGFLGVLKLTRCGDKVTPEVIDKEQL